MSLFTPQGLAGVLATSPLLAIAAAAGLGLLTSVGPCTFLRAATLFGLVGERPEKRQGLFIAMAFVAGLIVSYVLLGLLVTFASGLGDLTRVIYPVTGVLLVLLGLKMAKLLELPSWRGPAFLYRLRGRLTDRITVLNSFLLGATFALMVCPCCLPALLAIYAFAFANGQFAYGVILIVAFTVAHSIPLLFVGYLGRVAKQIAQARRYEATLNFLLGVLVFVTGVIVLWMT